MFVAFFYLLGIFVNNFDSSKCSDELIAVALTYRHGDRSPVESFPSDKYYNSTYWPMGYGQLTQFGIRRQHELGQRFRKRYKDFLDEIYSPKEIYIYSTETDRTLMSAYANLAGLYPPKNFQLWNSNILWQPIPVHSDKRSKDDIMVEKRKCNKFEKLYIKTKKLKYEMFNTKYANLFEYIQRHTGWANVTLDQVKTLRSNMYCYSNYNTSFIPEWYKSIDPELMEYLSVIVYELPTATRRLTRFSTGPFFDYLFQYFDAFINPVSVAKPKFLMISAHDTYLTSILNAMGASTKKPVNFADTVIWELKRRTDGTFFVNLLYLKENVLEIFKIHDCKFDCPYHNFVDIMSNVTISINDWLQECEN